MAGPSVGLLGDPAQEESRANAEQKLAEKRAGERANPDTIFNLVSFKVSEESKSA